MADEPEKQVEELEEKPGTLVKPTWKRKGGRVKLFVARSSTDCAPSDAEDAEDDEERERRESSPLRNDAPTL
jgi:hypothetical protein